VKTEKEYKAVMERINKLMKKGETKLTKEETDELRRLAVAAQKYERALYNMK
jgi:HTH-type transcriptional regulator/antitoxin HigA